MLLSIRIYPIDSTEVVLNPLYSGMQLRNIKIYVLSPGVRLRIIEDDCVVIVDMKTKQYYISDFPDDRINIDELRKEIDDNIRHFKYQLIRGNPALSTIWFKDQ